MMEFRGVNCGWLLVYEGTRPTRCRLALFGCLGTLLGRARAMQVAPRSPAPEVRRFSLFDWSLARGVRARVMVMRAGGTTRAGGKRGTH